MTKLEFERLLLPLVDIMNDIEMDMMRNILSRIDDYSDVKGTLKWLTDKLTETKVLDIANLETIKDKKKKIKTVIEEMAENCGYRVENIEKLYNYYEQGLLNVDPSSLYESTALRNMINNAIKDTDDIMELIQTKAVEGAKDTYMNILNKSYIETATGVYSYQEAIKRATDEFTKNGITAVHYKDGRTLSIEGVVRRDVITRMNKLSGDVEIEHAKELGTNLVYVDQHVGARMRTPYMKEDYEAHAEWQGEKYMIDGSNDKYDNLYEKTGYGEMLGLKGINCYHNLRPTFEWEEIPKRISLEENQKELDKLQKMRNTERKIRVLKRKRLIESQLGSKEEVKKIDSKLKTTNDIYDKWLNDNNLTRNYSREYISTNKYQFNDNKHITSKTKDDEVDNIIGTLKLSKEEHKACSNVYDAFKNNNYENLSLNDIDTYKQIGEINTSNSHSAVGFSDEQTKIMETAKDRSLIAIHNHPGNGTFSLNDIYTMVDYEKLGGIMVVTDEYIYSLKPNFNKGIINTKGRGYDPDFEMKIGDANDYVLDKYPMYSNNQLYHMAFKKVFDEMGWEYGRQKRK